ncbi:MAG TPA: 7-cyano-7-deazaguanine synthase [Vicinamibacterales bacterium]|nr:7-cyano-7-deazaguanine synthase [Vicinamibacterales bacterium]
MSTAVLLSGGLDSAVLLVDEASRANAGETVQPIYIGAGLAWETAERAIVSRFLEQQPLRSRVRPLAALSVDMRDVYAATHWSVTGKAPAYHTPDEDVYLPGRNVILLAKAGVFCAAAGLDRVVIGTLDHNPFPDATPAFRSSIAQTLSLGLAHPLRVDAPYASSSKTDVIRRGIALGVPFDLTLSCMNPVNPVNLEPPVHCGTCSKCRERHDAFLEAGVDDPTTYASVEFTRG